MEVKESRFVRGVMADLSGQPREPLARMRDRRFVEITPDNFDSVLESFKPHLDFAVVNKLSEDPNAGQLKVDLDLKSLEDFDPTQDAKHVIPMKDLLDIRYKLIDL